MNPDISIVIPVYNRGTLVRHTIDSVRAASTDLSVEIVLVDDGSKTPVADDLARLGYSVDQLIRQTNQGLLFARLAGLAKARGRHVLFLDSDDLISSEKLRAHVTALDTQQADVSYTDSAGQALDDVTGPVGPHDAPDLLPVVNEPGDFFITIQPAPHAPAFRTDYLSARVATAPFPPSPLYNAVAEIWFYHICASQAARVTKCAGLALVGRHNGPRLTNNWERLGVASLAVQEAFARTCPLDTAEGRRARSLSAAKALGGWRRLPRDFSSDFSRRLFSLWKDSPVPAPREMLGGRSFLICARLFGITGAALIFRRIQGVPYSASRTMDDADFERLLSQVPKP